MDLASMKIQRINEFRNTTRQLLQDGTTYTDPATQEDILLTMGIENRNDYFNLCEVAKDFPPESFPIVLAGENEGSITLSNVSEITAFQVAMVTWVFQIKAVGAQLIKAVREAEDSETFYAIYDTRLD